MVRRVLGAVALVVVLAPAEPAVAAPADREPGSEVSARLHRAMTMLRLGGEHTAGYDRDLFKHCVDADDDCQDTREEVLVAESRVPIDGCAVTTGEWFSYYDRETWTASSDVDIDHVVALGEAWDSGAWNWSAETRERYANDLGDRRSLVAVTDNVNQSKGDRDPAEWTPEFGTCAFVRQWTAVKLRWRLRVDQAEQDALVALAAGCPNSRLRVVRAR